jgi:predicted dehydrogenase
MEKIRFGIIGLGNMGSQHAAYLYAGDIEGAVLGAICDIKQSRLDYAKEAYPDVALFGDYKEMLASGTCDVVLIATPHYMHPVIAIDAFNAGLNVISEKPVGVYTKAVFPMIEAAKKSGKMFGVMFNQRTNPVYRKMREIVQSGELGELKRMVWIITDWYRTQYYYDSGDWRATWAGEGGGVLLNQCPHNLDLWQWIFGMPKSVTSFCEYGKYHNIEVEDDVTAYAKYENGATAVFITTTGECPGTNRLEISGSKGKLVAEGNTLTWTKLKVDEREYCFNATNGFSQPESETVVLTPEYEMKEQHRGITQNVTNHLLHGEPLIAEGYEGINGLTLSNAIMLSTWKNRTVELDEPTLADEFYAELKKKIDGSGVKKSGGSNDVADISGTYNN